MSVKLFLLSALFFILYSLFIIQPAFAQTSTPSALPISDIRYPISIPPTSPQFTDLLMQNTFHTFSCLMVGGSVIGQPCLTYQVTKNAQGMIQSVPVLSQTNLSGGTLGVATSLIGMLYANPPVKTAAYLASVGEGLGLVKPAHAQVTGSGADVLRPIETLWKVSRNIAYLVMIIIFVIIGLMVMFRQRINPQTVITAQAALPGLVLGLILITFSYFLAGLISDMAFVGTNLVGVYFTAAHDPPLDPPQNLVEDINNQNVLRIFTPFTKIISQGKVSNALNSIWNDLVDPNTNRENPFDLDPQKVLTNLAALIILQLVMPFGGLFGGPGQLVFGGISVGGILINPTGMAGLAIAFIAITILIYTMFRLLLRLINNYISIIFLTITAPFQFLAASLPGRQGIATRWILGMLANVLAFPAVIAALYFVAYLIEPDALNQYCTDPCPFKISQLNRAEYNTLVSSVHAQDQTGQSIVGKETFPLFGGMDLSLIKLLLAFGVLVALPKIPDLVARAIGGLSEAGQLIGQEISSSVGAGRGYAGQFQQGAGGMAGQVGRLTDQPGWQLIPDPNYVDPVTGAKPGYRVVPTTTFGQIARARQGWGTFRAGIRNRFGF